MTKGKRGAHTCLAGGGEMGALMRAIDWSTTPLGPVESWSQALRAIVSMMLANRFPMLLWWGPDYVQLYNDAYAPVPGTKHPKSMGQRACDCWPEIWHILRPLIDTPFDGGPATWMEDILLEVNRHGFLEETHFTIAYSPVPDEAAPRGIGGVLATVHEITEKVVGERRIVALRDLGARAAEAKTAEQACVIAGRTLANHAKDIPFALLYLIDRDGKRARLAWSAGIDRGEAARPRVVELADAADPACGWPLAEAMRREEMVSVEDLAARFGAVPPGPWSDPPHAAVVVPVRSNKVHELAALLVAGVSPRLRLDELYRSFLDLVAAQVATAIANARAYEEERKRAEALAEIDRAKTAFFSNVSHEFRTPLTLMLGPLEDALAAPAESLPVHRDDLALVHRNSLRLLRLVNTLLDFSRIEAGRVQASFEPLDLAAATADLASVFRAATDKAGLSLTVDCPPLGEPAWVDRDMWEKIVLNLISNAFKFTLEGGIAVRLHRAGGSAVLEVEDTGTGIPETEIPRLFDRFYRVEGARGRTQEGTGIGLALVQELVRLHGGAVRAESTHGKGSRFIVSIPLGTAHLPPERLRAERTLASTALGAQPYVKEALRWLPDEGRSEEPGIERPLLSEALPAASVDQKSGRATILLADDNADMRDYVRHLLSARYDVRAVADGAQALAALEARLPDLLLSDIMMPRMSGFELLRAVRSDARLARLPVILLSARAGEEASIEGLEAGADDYLIKPFSARELMARVAANLEMARVRREAAAMSEHRFRFLAEAMPQKIFTTAADGLVDYCNRQWLEFAGLPLEEIMGLGWARIIHPDDNAENVVRWRHSLATGEPFQYAHRFRRRDGAYRWHLTRVHPVREEDGAIAMWIGSSTDIHEQKETEAAYRDLSDTLERKIDERSRALEAEVAERQKVEAALQQAQRLESLGQLTGGVAHDFNNLLTVVLGQIESIMLVAKEDPRILRMAASAQRAAERGAQLTSQLLAFSRRQQLQPRAIAMDRVIVAVGELVRRVISEAIALDVSAAPGLWPAHLDPAQFEAAILNLTINARDAMPKGGRLTIRARNETAGEIEARRLDVAPGPYIVVDVTDTGAGMAPEVRRRAFEPFFTTKDIGKGTGLGLAQIYGFVKQSGGTATIESALGRGTTVSLYLPKAEAAVIDDEEEEASPDGGASVPGQGKTILVVDDQPAVREAIEAPLARLGYRIIEAADGLAARKLLESDLPIDLLLTDVVMPHGVSGLDLVDEARRLRRDLKIVLVSGYLREFGGRAGGLSGVIFLEKPFKQTDLANAVATALGEGRKPRSRAAPAA
jgi:PAS domain S-box-containing protein